MPDHASPIRQDVTAHLRSWRDGDESAAGRLLTIVYDELHRLAERAMRREGPEHTLQATELVSEVYLRLVGSDVEWQDRAHFYAVAARTMRRFLVDHARARRAGKRGSGAVAVTLTDVADMDTGDPHDLVALDEALDRLADLDGRQAKAIELHYFAGLSYEETADMLGMSAATVHRDLRMAKSWLYQQLAEAP